MTKLKFLDKEKTPLLEGWADWLYEHEVVRELMPEADEMVEFSKILQANWNAVPAK